MPKAPSSSPTPATLVFLSDRADWHFRTLGPVPEAAIETIARTRQYPPGTLAPLNARRAPLNDEMDLLTVTGADDVPEEFVSQTMLIAAPAWRGVDPDTHGARDRAGLDGAGDRGAAGGGRRASGGRGAAAARAADGTDRAAAAAPRPSWRRAFRTARAISTPPTRCCAPRSRNAGPPRRACAAPRPNWCRRASSRHSARCRRRSVTSSTSRWRRLRPLRTTPARSSRGAAWPRRGTMWAGSRPWPTGWRRSPSICATSHVGRRTRPAPSPWPR